MRKTNERLPPVAKFFVDGVGGIASKNVLDELVLGRGGEVTSLQWKVDKTFSVTPVQSQTSAEDPSDRNRGLGSFTYSARKVV